MQTITKSIEKQILDPNHELLKNQIQDGTLSVVESAEDKITN